MVNVLSVLCFSTLFLSNLAGASSDHSARRVHHDPAHVRAIQRRAAEDHYAAVKVARSEGVTPAAPARKRGDGRCKPRTSSSTLSPATTTTSKLTTVTTKAAETTTTSVGLGNVGGKPTTTKTTSKAKPTTTSHKTTTTKKAQDEPSTTSSKAPATTTQSSGGGGSGQTYSGDGTYYGVGLGACGWTNTDEDLICAVSHTLYDNWPGATANPNDNPICGRYITAHYGDKSVRVKVVDRCVGCAEYDLDFSPTAFSQLADQSLGRIKITWQWS